MEVLFALDGLTLEKKWNGYYIRFMGEQMDDLPCEIRITSEEAAKIKKNKEAIREILDKYKDGRIPWTEEFFMNSGIVDYLLFKGISIDRVKRNFLDSFDWNQYHNDKYAKKKFYQYVWHEVVNFYYFKQDYYVYNKIFNLGYDLDFRKTFADYSIDCRFLTTKANIMKDTSDQKNIDNPWYTSRTATYDSNYVQP